ncbi:MAG: hypothetical protein AB1767_05660 [Bacillota bacterium]
MMWSGRLHPPPDILGALPRALLLQLVVVDPGHIHLQVNAVQERPEEAAR